MKDGSDPPSPNSTRAQTSAARAGRLFSTLVPRIGPLSPFREAKQTITRIRARIRTKERTKHERAKKELEEGKTDRYETIRRLDNAHVFRKNTLYPTQRGDERINSKTKSNANFSAIRILQFDSSTSSYSFYLPISFFSLFFFNFFASGPHTP